MESNEASQYEFEQTFQALKVINPPKINMLKLVEIPLEKQDKVITHDKGIQPKPLIPTPHNINPLKKSRKKINFELVDTRELVENKLPQTRFFNDQLTNLQLNVQPSTSDSLPEISPHPGLTKRSSKSKSLVSSQLKMLKQQNQKYLNIRPLPSLASSMIKNNTKIMSDRNSSSHIQPLHKIDEYSKKSQRHFAEFTNKSLHKIPMKGFSS